MGLLGRACLAGSCFWASRFRYCFLARRASFSAAVRFGFSLGLVSATTVCFDYLTGWDCLCLGASALLLEPLEEELLDEELLEELLERAIN